MSAASPLRPARSERSGRPERPSGSGGWRILVVEDNELLRQIVGQVLHGLGLRDVRYVRKAADGLRAFAAQPAHLVIVEFGRDCQAAFDMLRALAQSPACAHGKIGLIALVPEPNRERVIKAHDAGAEA
ncbi:MAG: hypothetical protein ACQGVC_14200, partial [Myxococcota bacterium]